LVKRANVENLDASKRCNHTTVRRKAVMRVQLKENDRAGAIQTSLAKRSKDIRIIVA
jgi:hypothetical protein